MFEGLATKNRWVVSGILSMIRAMQMKQQKVEFSYKLTLVSFSSIVSVLSAGGLSMKHRSGIMWVKIVLNWNEQTNVDVRKDDGPACASISAFVS